VPEVHATLHSEAVMGFRYTRWQDRLLALIWPPKRKRLRMLNMLVKSSEKAVEHEMNRIALDLTLYGESFIHLDDRT